MAKAKLTEEERDIIRNMQGFLQYVLDEGPRNDWFDDQVISSWAIIAAITGTLFFWRMLTYHKPIVELRILRNHNFSLGCLMGVVAGMGLFGGVYITPLFLARVQGFNAYQIGTVMSVMGIAMLCIGPVAGLLSEKVSARLALGCGIVLAAAGMYINAQLTAESGYDELFWPQILRGMGFATMLISVNIMALSTLPTEELNNASGIFNLSRNMGGALGLAGANTLLANRYDLHFARLADWINPARAEFQQLMEGSAAIQVSEQAVLAMVKGKASLEALVMTFNDVHLVMAGFLVFTLFFLPFMNSPQRIHSGAH